MPRLNPADVEACLRVLAVLHEADGDPAVPAVHDAMVGAYKRAKKRQKVTRRRAAAAHDREVMATADQLASADQLAAAAAPAAAGLPALYRARRCYVCKEEYRIVHRRYSQLCQGCAETDQARRDARCDLTGRRALVTGGRIKIGFHIALKLLRDGADVLVTTRFPRDAARRFAAQPDAEDWLDRLHIHGADFLDMPSVAALVDAVGERWSHLDILVNNAAQTIRRPAEYHREVRAAELEPLRGPAAAVAVQGGAHTETDLTTYFPAGQVDETGEPLDLSPVNSWSLRLHEVTPQEWLEVHVVNAFVPFLLTARLRPLLAAAPSPDRYVVNVSAMEGSFSRRNKTADHPHTNMAKAGLNMLTRTIASDYVRDGIFVTSVDTGWITDERPHPAKERVRAAGFRTPLDVVDGAARVYDPVVRGVQGAPVWGVFLKDYRVVDW